MNVDLNDSAEFDGDDYDSDRDKERLTKQRDKIRMYMEGRNYLTVKEVAEVLNYPENSVSAQMRNLRKEKFGGRIVHREYFGNGLYKFKLMPKEEL
jgi:transcriptional antiterminator